MRGYDLTLTEDAYAIKGFFRLCWSEVRLPCLLDRQLPGGYAARERVPKQARAVLDSTLYLDSVSAAEKKTAAFS